jgi:hypothetical protein
MINIYSFIFFIITMFLYLFYNHSILIEYNILNKFLVFLILLVINCFNIIFNYLKNKQKINGINTIKLSFYYSFIGTFAYIIFFDLINIQNNQITKTININIKILFCALFITISTILFYNKLLL